MTGKHLYFAFGMNMDPDMMRLPGPPIPLGRAVLPGWGLRMRFFADIQEAEGEQVYGVLWELTDDALRQLDGREGYRPDIAGGGMYDRREVTVLDHDGNPQQAFVYFMTDRCRAGGGAPASPSYLDMLYRGLAHFGHGPEAFDAVNDAQAEVAPPRTFMDDFRDHYPDGLTRHPDSED